MDYEEENLMAQTFVYRADLAIEDAENPVRVAATYGNGMILTIGFMGPQFTLMLLADNLIFNDRDNQRTILVPHWRDDYVPVISYEATRRINLAFPDYKQRNYTAHYQDNITKYGADSTNWPPAELTFKGEYDRGWKYVNDVRSAANAWTAMPTDPTADQIWPPAITPIA
jgi:hypothetical protein